MEAGKPGGKERPGDPSPNLGVPTLPGYALESGDPFSTLCLPG